MINLKILGSDARLYPNKDGGGFGHGSGGDIDTLKATKTPTADDYMKASEDYAKELRKKQS